MSLLLAADNVVVIERIYAPDESNIYLNAVLCCA
jgi:hypothetical protein